MAEKSNFERRIRELSVKNHNLVREREAEQKTSRGRTITAKTLLRNAREENKEYGEKIKQLDRARESLVLKAERISREADDANRRTRELEEKIREFEDRGLKEMSENREMVTLKQMNKELQERLDKMKPKLEEINHGASFKEEILIYKNENERMRDKLPQPEDRLHKADTKGDEIIVQTREERLEFNKALLNMVAGLKGYVEANKIDQQRWN